MAKGSSDGIDWKRDGNVIVKYLPSIREALGRGDRATAKELVRELGHQVYFPRIDEVLKEYDNPSAPAPTLWGAWGPETDLVAQGTSSIDSTFLPNAGYLMTSKGFTTARITAAELAGVKGAMYSASMEANSCALCRGLDMLEVLVPSQQYDEIAPPQHCGCSCLMVYTDEEEVGYEPNIVPDWRSRALDQANADPAVKKKYDNFTDLVRKNGHANPWWEAQTEKNDVDLRVTQRVIQRLQDNLLADMLIDEAGAWWKETEEEGNDTTD